MGEETTVDEEKSEAAEAGTEREEEEGEVKWCQPVSVISDDSSSSEDERVKLSYPFHTEGHKFSDGIVWETIEEEEEEEEEEVSSCESDKDEVTMNAGAERTNTKIDLNEGNIMQAGDTPGKKEVDQQSHKPFITELTRVNKPERGSVRDMDTTEEEPESTDYPYTSLEEYDESECQLKDDEKDCPVSKEELGNISVKNLARFWEEVSKKVKDEAEKSEPVIQKKWNSMPNLKDKYEKRQLPAVPSSKPVTAAPKVVRSDEVIDDVDLCRSVSLRDRKQLFEMLSKQSKREKAKQWSSMPSLKEERKLPHLPSSAKTRVRWEDEDEDEDEEDERVEAGFVCESELRGRSPVRELMKSFEQIPQQHPAYQRSPVSPQVRRNEIFSLKDENYSSSDSISSSLTCSSLSTVIQRSPRPASLYDESAGEIYTEPENNNTNSHDEALYVVENGLEYSLAPLNSRKSKFEHQTLDRIRPTVSTEREATRSLSSIRRDKPSNNNHPRANEMDRIKSSNVPYIEEEKDILKNINVVQSLKSKFLN